MNQQNGKNPILFRREARSTVASVGSKHCLRAGMLLAAIAAMPAQAANYFVLNVNDSGEGSLRAAIQAANAHVGSDRIVFATAGMPVVLASPLPAFADDVEVVGPDTGIITISGSNAVSVFRVNTGVSVKMSMLTVEAGNQASGDGGCFNNAGNLILEGVIVQSCTADGDGGGIFNAATGSVTLEGSYVYQSEAYQGGGIFNQGDLFVEADSHVIDNDASFGAGIYNEEGASIALTGSHVWGNQASISGGGILNSGGAVAITDSWVGGNTASWDAGGVLHDGSSSSTESLLISGSLFYQNSAGTEGGALETIGAGATISGSTFEGNSAASGGAIHVGADGMHIRNSTFSANTAGTGGALLVDGPDPTLSQVTLADNSASQPGGIATIAGDFIAKNIILVGAGVNCSGVVTALGHNLLQAGSDFSCNGFDAVFPSELLLGTYDYHGGLIKNYALPAGSVAIDSAVDCSDALDNPVSVDQRGMPRPADGDGNGSKVCDVGAFEALADVIFANGFD